MENFALHDDNTTDSGTDSDEDAEQVGEEEVDENPNIQWVESKRKKPILILNGNSIQYYRGRTSHELG